MTQIISPFTDESLEIPGEVPLFPLPEMVLLPGEPMPLHIFEDRYKAMTETALAGERMIVMGHLKPGWDKPRVTNEETYNVAGVGQIVMDERLHDGRFNLILLGLKRIRIKQITQQKPYSKALVEVIEDRCSDTSSAVLASLEHDIIEAARQILKVRKNDKLSLPEGFPAFETIVPGALPLGTLCDFAAASIFLPPTEKQMILEEIDVIKRAQTLLFLLRFQWELIRNGVRQSPLN